MRSPEDIEKLLDRLESFFGDYDKAEDEYKRNQWHDHFAEKLGPYEDKLKALNGDDFSIYDESYNEYNKDFKDLGEDEYVAALTANIDKLLDKLRGALGEEKVELESGPEGTEVVAHEDKGIEANNVSEEPEVKPEEPKVEEEVKLEEDEMTSDGRAKKMAGWKSPSKSGGRDGHSGLPGTYKSDENCKEEPVETESVETEQEPVEPKDEYEEFLEDLKKYQK